MSDVEDPGEHNTGTPEPPLMPSTEQQMVFRARSNSPPPTRLSHKKLAVKNVSARLKGRKSTPAPPTKGDGRKRFINSPGPEDKQIRKKIDFGSNEEGREDEFDDKPDSGQDLVDEDTEEHGENFPPANECRALVTVPAEMESAASLDGECIMPEAAPVAEMDFPASEGAPLSETATRGERLEAHEAKDDSAVIVVKLPEMAKETNLGYESALEPTHLEESRVAADLGAQEQPKMNSLLQVVSLDSAEMLDCESAQPLLWRDHSEKHPFSPTPLHGNSGTEMIIQPIEGHYIAPLEHFPPLERGRTRKIRDSFEKGTPLASAVPVWLNRQETVVGAAEQGTKRDAQAGA